MMHLDHEHEGAHEHVHTHADGTTHSHPHTHDHDHEHSHPHSHGCETTNCASCGGCGEHTPKEELVALMKYMVNHNTAHANELAELAKKLGDLGDKTAYEQVMLAVSDFEKGNLRLSTILAAMQE
ncbi:MAG: cobalt transporter [Candidatus Avoscillospira sp.]